MNKWLDDIRSLGVFLICAQMLIHFRPKSSYVKYLRLLISLILLAQFVEPIGRIAGILEKGQIQNMMREMQYDLQSKENELSEVYDDHEKILERLLEKLEIEDQIEGSKGEG